MELLFLSLLVTFLLLLLKLSNDISGRPRNTWTRNLPPGPCQLPIIGSIHHMLGSLPHRRLMELSRIHGPIMHLKLGELTNIIVSSGEVAKEIMKTHDLIFSSRPQTLVTETSYGGKSLVFAPYGEFWREMRKTCVLELLSTKRVQSFRSIREEEVKNLISSIAKEPVVNLTKRLNAHANEITVRAVIGDRCKDQATFLDALKESTDVTGSFDLPDFFPSSSLLKFFSMKRIKLERIHRTLDVFIEAILQEHKQRKLMAIDTEQLLHDEDLLDVLLQVQERGNLTVPFTDDCLKAVILEIFGAGSETTATTLSWIMTELVRNPRVMDKAQLEVRGVLQRKGQLTEDEMNELGYMKQVIKEAMRLHLPIPLIPRECRKRCKVLGYEIPEKARVIVNAWAIGRDRHYWGEDAEEFRPERFDRSCVDFKGMDFEYIPFGAGRRMCPGVSFALADIELVVAQLLCYFDWKLLGNADPKELDMDEVFGASARRRNDLWLHAIPRIPVPFPSPY